MNFYPHHIGDYLTATAHLTWVEDCAYRRLLDVYYSRESALPLDVAQAARLVRATGKDERKAVETVLREFFQETPDGWKHGRCEEEIAKAAGIAERARENGKKGGNPYKKQQYNEPGFLYALDIGGGSTKVGITKNPQQRLYEHRRKFKGCQYLLVVSVRDMGKCEDDVLKAFAQYAVGEKLDLPANVAPKLLTHMETLGSPVGSPNDGAGLPPITNPITSSSVAKATGGAAATSMEPAEIIFGYGLPLLTNAGTPEKQARSFLGALRKRPGGDAAVVDAIRECLRAKPLQPLEWLGAALPPEGAAAKPGKHSGFSNLNYSAGVNADGTLV